MPPPPRERLRTRRTTRNASAAASTASSASNQAGVAVLCERLRSPTETSASGVGSGAATVGVTSAGMVISAPDWSRPTMLTDTIFGVTVVEPPTCVVALLDPVPDVPVLEGFVIGVVFLEVLELELELERELELGGGCVVCVAATGAFTCGVAFFAGGVAVVAGASGFLIGFGPAAATAGSASASASRNEARSGDLIEGMIQDRPADRKEGGPATPCAARVAAMPIHLRAEPGDYAEAVLLPGDPLRARHIAETFFDSPRQVNGERGMLGFTGTFEGAPISVQSSGMGCPSAAIVIEELIQLGVKRIVRVGTCGGLQTDMQLGDLILAISAVPSDGTVLTYTGGEPHAPTADFELVHAAVHQAKHDGTKLRVGPCVSSSTFYDPDTGRAQRWSERGVLGVEMEAAVLFTIAALRRIQAACLLTVSDIIVEGEFVRISDAELKAAVDNMTELAIRAALSKAKS